MKDLIFVDFEGLPRFGNIMIELAIVVVLGLIVIKILIAVLRRTLKKSSTDPVLYTFIIKSVKVLLIIILGIMCLGILNVSMTSIIAVLGAAGAAIALALRDSLANIAGGVMIIVTKPFNQNDLIDVGEIRGTVHNDSDNFGQQDGHNSQRYYQHFGAYQSQQRKRAQGGLQVRHKLRKRYCSCQERNMERDFEGFKNSHNT